LFAPGGRVAAGGAVLSGEKPGDLPQAQQSERVRRVGMLIGYAEQDQQVQARIGTFEQALQELGWTSGRNVQFTYRWERGDAERMRIYAAELIGLAPDVILTATTSALAAARR
jgi:putative ABC transport system substrate-binding protein